MLKEEIKNDKLDAIDQLITDIYDQRKQGIAEDGEYSLGNLLFKEFRNRGYLDNLKELKNKVIGQELSLKESNNFGDGNEKSYDAEKSEMEDQLRARGQNYNFDKFDKKQLYHMLKNNVPKKIQQQKTFTPEIKKDIKYCNICGERLSDGGYCPKCENEDDFLSEGLEYKTMKEYRDILSRISYNQAIVQENGLFNIYNVKQDDVNRIVNQIRDLDFIEWVQSSADGFDFSHVGIPGALQPRKYHIYGKIKN